MALSLAHIYNHAGVGGGNSQATTLLNGWAAHSDIDPWGVHAVNMDAPDNAVYDPDPEDGRDYPLMYPTDIANGLRDIDPDIVFVHGFSPELNRILRDLHDAPDFDATFVLRKGMNVYEHWGLIFKHQNPEKITTQVADFDWYDCIIAPTQHVADRLALYYGADAPEIAYVPNGINRDQYVPSSFRKNGPLKVVTASRGGPNDFLPAPLLAVARILDAEEFPIELTMMGANFGPADTVIKTLAADYDNITVKGHLDHAVVRSHLEAADVVCVPSISQQAIPLVALEGMAAGNIVLASFPEATEEEALIRLPATHPPAWHEALTDAYEDPDDAREWIRKGIEAASNYDLTRIVDDGYLPVFERLLEGGDEH